MPIDLPGYHFDHERGKYFRIAPDNRSAPGSAAAKYSYTAVADLRKSATASFKVDVSSSLNVAANLPQLVKVKRQDDEQRQADTIKRANILQHPVSTLMSRETGRYPHFEKYSQGFGASDFSTLRARRFERRRIRRWRDGVVQGIARHAPSGCLIAGHSSRRWMYQLNEHNDKHTSAWGRETWPGDFYKRMMFAGQRSELLIAVTASGDVVSKRFDNGDPGSDARHDKAWIHHHLFEGSLFDAAAAPNTNGLRLALASGDVIVMDFRPDTMRSNIRVAAKTNTPSDTLSTRWQNSNVLAFGRRSGRVLLHDIRTPRDRVARLKHLSSACHIRYADASAGSPRLLVAGLENKLALYDLRYCDPGRSEPWLTYPDYQNKANINLGFDVDPFTGVIAAANDGGGVTPLDLWSGARLRTNAFDTRWPSPADPGYAGNREFLITCDCPREHPPNAQQMVGCIQFEHDETRDNGVGYCLLGTESQIKRCIWGRGPGESEPEWL